MRVTKDALAVDTPIWMLGDSAYDVLEWHDFLLSQESCRLRRTTHAIRTIHLTSNTGSKTALTNTPKTSVSNSQYSPGRTIIGRKWNEQTKPARTAASARPRPRPRTCTNTGVPCTVSPRNRRSHQLRKRTQSRTYEAQNPVIDSMTRSRRTELLSIGYATSTRGGPRPVSVRLAVDWLLAVLSPTVTAIFSPVGGQQRCLHALE